MTLQLGVANRSRDALADLAIKVFERPQGLIERLLTADYAKKRRCLEIVFSTFGLDGVSLVAEMRKPFDALAKALLVQSNRSDGTPVELFLRSCVENGALIATVQN